MRARCALAGLLLGASGYAAAAPMSYLRTFGPAGDPSTALGWGMGLLSLAVMFIIALLVLVGSLKRRRHPTSWRELTVSRDEGGMGWLYIGVGLTILALIGFVVWTMFTMVALAMPASAGDLTVKVTGSQWWWAVQYTDKDRSQTFATANEIHIPVGQPVRLELSSSDVIHSFWVPQLVGKTDTIPGQTNVMWLQADKAGVYRGQCTQYCGAQHAHMAMYVVADEPNAYAAWLQDQLEPAPPPASDLARRGASAFASYCAACHAVRGSGAGGILGPDLTHLMSRKTIAAGLLPNTPGNLAAWIANAQALKPGSRMPSLTLSAPDLHAIVTYLDTLQ
jgi:cytochrome c oxidase subunit 2